MRFIAFGCSFTYGEGLADCVSKNRQWAGPNPSEMAWAALLAKQYNYELVNCSKPGTSNYHIAHQIQSFDWQKDDVALILFTFFHRYTIFDSGILPMNITPHDVNVHSKMHRAKAFYELFDNEHLVLNDTLSIDSTFYCLSYHQVPVIASFVGDIQRETYLEHTRVKDNKWLNLISKNDFLKHKVDIGLDKGEHPGPETHRLFAESLVDDIDNVINMRK
jgi:hypothetical protein